MVTNSDQNEYILRIHKVQDYIENHYFQNLSVEELADVAGFSKYHFNRIFKGILKESVLQYINRIRIEHSLFFLSYRLDKNLTDIAYELGFSDSAVFSRAFKNYYGISPYQYRKENSTKCKESIFISEYNKPVKNKIWVQKPLDQTGEIRIEELKPRQVVYVRHVGDYQSLEENYEGLLQQLFHEAAKQNLLIPEKNDVLVMYHDNPEFGKEEQFRTSLCLTCPEQSHPSENSRLGVMWLDGGLFAIGHFEIYSEQFEDAWDYIYQKWLVNSRYFPRDACPFECYLNNPMEEKDHLIKVDIYMPIEPM